MSADRAVPFDAARVDGDLARIRQTAPAWQTSLRHDLGRLRASRRRVIARLDATRRIATPNEPGNALSWQRYVDVQVAAESGEAVVASIGESLEQAQTLLDGAAKTPTLRRLFRAGSIFESAMGSLQRARESLFLVEEDAWVRAQLPTLRASVATIMGSDDPRTEGYLRYLDDLTRGWLPAPTDPDAPGLAPDGPSDGGTSGPNFGGAGVGGAGAPVPLQVVTGSVTPIAPATVADAVATQRRAAALAFDSATREQLRAIQTAIDDARMASQIAVRVYRNALVVAIVVLAAVAVLFPILAGGIDPGMAAVRGVDAAGMPVGALVSNLAAVEVWGVLGSAVAVIAGLWRLRSSRQPSGLQLAQLALKVPAGALTALFGVLLLQGGIVLQLKAVEPGQVPAYAILFGFAQEALTRFVDGKAGQLLDNAKPLSDKSG